jgi:hypothetical protein
LPAYRKQKKIEQLIKVFLKITKSLQNWLDISFLFEEFGNHNVQKNITALQIIDIKCLFVMAVE